MAVHLRSVTFVSRSFASCAPILSRNIHSTQMKDVPNNDRRARPKFYQQHQIIFGVLASRNASTAASPLPMGYVPDIPVAPDISCIPNIPDPTTIIDLPSLNALGEPTLDSLGLGRWTPPGMVQNLAEYLHVSLDLPWFAVIGVFAVTIRVCLLPLMVKSKRALINLTNHNPTITRLQQLISEAKMKGDVQEAQVRNAQLLAFLKDNDIKLSQAFLQPAVQLPIMVSVFFALRGMAFLPVESLKTGGFGWVTDLTLVDPYFILPAITGISLLAMLELGAESTKVAEMKQFQRWALRFLPLIAVVATAKFPAAIAIYWTMNNILSLILSQAFKLPKVKAYLNLPEQTQHSAESQPKQKKFVEGFKEMYESNRTSTEIALRKVIDDNEFAKAGPLPKKDAYNPSLNEKRSVYNNRSSS